jgi:hypothetical protein
MCTRITLSCQCCSGLFPSSVLHTGSSKPKPDKLVVDAAQSQLTEYKGRSIPSVSLCVLCSFVSLSYFLRVLSLSVSLLSYRYTHTVNSPSMTSNPEKDLEEGETEKSTTLTESTCHSHGKDNAVRQGATGMLDLQHR